jgi:hypothetical protein
MVFCRPNSYGKTVGAKILYGDAVNFVKCAKKFAGQPAIAVTPGLRTEMVHKIGVRLVNVVLPI